MKKFIFTAAIIMATAILAAEYGVAAGIITGAIEALVCKYLSNINLKA